MNQDDDLTPEQIAALALLQLDPETGETDAKVVVKTVAGLSSKSQTSVFVAFVLSDEPDNYTREVFAFDVELARLFHQSLGNVLGALPSE